MALPDSFQYQSILTLSQRGYWHDGYFWNGNLPAGQLILIFLNIIIISLGLAYSWKLHRWGGCFLVYDLSLSLSVNSGGRYLVPINWIVFFYYGLGVLSILLFALRFLQIHLDQNEYVDDKEPVDKGGIRSLIPTGVLLIFIASLVPISNLLLPKIISPLTAASPTIVLSASGIIPETGKSYFQGMILYPYTEQGDISLVFINDLDVENYTITNEQVLVPTTYLKSGENAIFEFSPEDELTGVYIVRAGKYLEYWRTK